MNNKKRNYGEGFTIIEMLVVVAILSLFALVLLGIQIIISQTQVEVWKNYLGANEANSNITALTRELRNTRTADNGAYALVRAQDQEIIFYSDVDNDGQTERIRYTLSGTTLTKGVIEPLGYPVTYPTAQEKVKVVGENIRNGSIPIFYYYNGDWPEDTTNNPLDTPVRLSDTKLMKVYLEINPTANDNRRTFVLESYVQIRTLKQNL